MPVSPRGPRVRTDTPSPTASPRLRHAWPSPGLLAVLLAALLTLPVAGSAAAQGEPTATPPAPEAETSTGVITGTVTTAVSGKSPAGTEVLVVDQRQRQTVGEDGAFRFENLPPGLYLVHAEGPVGHGIARVRLAAGETAEVAIPIDITVMEEMVVSAGPAARSRLDVAQPTSVLTGEELDQRQGATLGETLNEEPGVSSTYFGPGASRPVIRGLGGERVRTLQGGIGSADAAGTSPDHAVASDPLSAERIEVLRGPATLLYGSSAVGGVVNTLDGRIPDYVPEESVTGKAEVGGGTSADERYGAVSLTGGSGELAWHVDYSRREADDQEIPDDARAEDGDLLGGLLENSAIDNESGAVGVSWVGDRGYFGVSASGFDTLYGVPAGHHHGHEDDHGDEHGEDDHGEDDHGEDGEEGHGDEHDDEHGDEHEGEEEEEAIRIDLEQRRVDLEGRYLLADPAAGFVDGLKVRFGVADYEHVELEGDEIGTRFGNDSWEGRLELVQRPVQLGFGDLTGSIGLQASSSDFVAIGEEAFVPPSVTDDLAVFAFQELARGPLTYQFGVRAESRDVDPEGNRPDRSLDGVSGSLGVVWRLSEEYSATASLSRTERLPTATELFADGPHVATQSFEIGDPGLDAEDSTGLDLSLKTDTELVDGAVNVFYNSFDGYIYEEFTGGEEDGLDVVRFVQRDADFIGAEVDLLWRLAELGDGHLDLRTRADYVRAELSGGPNDGDPLPRIPPLRFGLGLSYHGGPWRSMVEVRHAEEQDRVSNRELPTDGHTLLNASVSYRLFAAGTVTDVVLRGTNLTDEVARNHVSFLKEDVPLPGRDLSLLLRVAF